RDITGAVTTDGAAGTASAGSRRGSAVAKPIDAVGGCSDVGVSPPARVLSAARLDGKRMLSGHASPGARPTRRADAPRSTEPHAIAPLPLLPKGSTRITFGHVYALYVRDMRPRACASFGHWFHVHRTSDQPCVTCLTYGPDSTCWQWVMCVCVCVCVCV